MLMIVIPAYLFLQETKKKEKIRALLKQPWRVGFLLYFSFLLICTLFCRSITNPVQSVFDNFGFVTTMGKVNTEFVENVLLFIPYTILFLNGFSTENAWKDALKVSFFSSCAIELCQLIFWAGEFQFSDIVHNTLGGMIGAGIWFALQWLRCKVGSSKVLDKEKH